MNPIIIVAGLLWNWQDGEFERLRNVPWLRWILRPLALIFIGAALGGISPTAKTILILAGIVNIWIEVAVFLWRHKEIGVALLVELTVLFVPKRLLHPGQLAKIAIDEGARFLQRFVTGILVAITTVGLLLRWLPFHSRPLSMGLIAVGAGAIVFWFVHYQTKSNFWRNLGYWAAIMTIVEGLLRAFLPEDGEVQGFLTYIGFPNWLTLWFSGLWSDHQRVLIFAAVLAGVTIFLFTKIRLMLRGGAAGGANPSSAAPAARSASAAAKNENAGWIMCFGTLLAAMVTFAFVIMWYDSRGHQMMYFWAILAGVAVTTLLGTRGKDSKKALMFMCLPGAFMSLLFLATIVQFRPY